MFFSNKKSHEVFAQISVSNVRFAFVEGNVWPILLNVSAFIVISNVDIGMHAQK
jgi:hypothetical protein